MNLDAPPASCVLNRRSYVVLLPWESKSVSVRYGITYMLKHLILHNFKAFGNRTVFDFAPITLIYGRNSSGKSSILQSLLLLRQSRGGYLDFEGQLTDLGSAEHAYTHRKSMPADSGQMEVTALFTDDSKVAGSVNPRPRGNCPQGIGFVLGKTAAPVEMVPYVRPVYLEDPHVVSFNLPPALLIEAPFTLLEHKNKLDNDIMVSSTYLSLLHKKYKCILPKLFSDNIQLWLQFLREAPRDPELEKMLQSAEGRDFWRQGLEERLQSFRWAPPLPVIAADCDEPKAILALPTRAKRISLNLVRNPELRSSFALDNRLIKCLRYADFSDQQSLDYYDKGHDVVGRIRHLNAGSREISLATVSSAELLPFLIETLESSLHSYQDEELSENQVLEEIGAFRDTCWGLFPHYFDMGSEDHRSKEHQISTSFSSRLLDAVDAQGLHRDEGISDFFDDWRERIVEAAKATDLGLDGIRYIGPHRSQVPRFRVAAPSTGPVDQRGRTTDARLHSSDDLRSSTNGWLKRFGLPYELKLGSTGFVHGRTLTTMELVHRRNGAALASSDVGYGVSQILPIIVQASTLSEGILLVEQPELHLHPAMQANIGTLFAETIKGNPQAQIVAETHSEHLIRRIQRLVGLGRSKGGLDPADISIICVDQDRNGVSFHTQIPLNRQGNFMVRWPGGFFDFEDGDDPESDSAGDSDDDALAEES